MSFRKEEKLKVHKSQLTNLLAWIFENGGTELHKPRIVSSTYFDNDDWAMYRDSEEGSIPRKKIRVRSYDKNSHKSETSTFEVKISSLEGRYKTTSENFNLKKIMNIGVMDIDYGVCKPRVRVTYERVYYAIKGIRLTVDQNIEYVLVDGKRESPNRIFDSEIAVEIKAPYGVPEEYLIKSFPFERVRFSKYSRAVNCLLENKSVTF